MRVLGKLADRFSWSLYCRSYLITLGLLLAGCAAWAVTRAPNGFGSLSAPFRFGVAVAVTAGIGLVVGGLAGSKAAIKRWADSWSKHDIAFPVMLIAVPVYVVLALVFPRK